MRIYEELPCGCLVSEDGGGGYCPCGIYYMDYVPPEESKLHDQSTKMYFDDKLPIEEIYRRLKIKTPLEQKIDKIIESILEMDFDIEIEQHTGRVIGFQGKYGLENAKSIIREILMGE